MSRRQDRRAQTRKDEHAQAISTDLDRVLAYLERDEKKNFLEAGKPANHIYKDIHALRGWLNKSVAMSVDEAAGNRRAQRKRDGDNGAQQ